MNENDEQELVDLRDAVESLKDIRDVQCMGGNWDYNSYMRGMANGLILAASFFVDGEPAFLEAPDHYLEKDIVESGVAHE